MRCSRKTLRHRRLRRIGTRPRSRGAARSRPEQGTGPPRRSRGTGGRCTGASRHRGAKLASPPVGRSRSTSRGHRRTERRRAPGARSLRTHPRRPQWRPGRYLLPPRMRKRRSRRVRPAGLHRSPRRRRRLSARRRGRGCIRGRRARAKWRRRRGESCAPRKAHYVPMHGARAGSTRGRSRAARALNTSDEEAATPVRAA